MSRRWVCILLTAGLLAFPTSADFSAELFMPLKFKVGVNQSGVVPEMNLGIQAVCSVFTKHGLDCVITSMHDGKHGDNSLHSRDGLCRAVDFRTKHIQSGIVKTMIVGEIKENLGSNYDVILEHENEANEHVHVEYDQKVQV